MFESDQYIFIEMEYIRGEQLKRIYDKRLEAARNALDGGFNEEDLRQRQF
jgi:serine/threonine protein kinase